jgi:hypothetical protein
MARLGSEARNRRDVTLLREGLLSILFEGKNVARVRLMVTKSCCFTMAEIGRHGEFSLVVLTPALALSCGWLGKIWGCGGLSLGDASCEKGGIVL